MKATENDAVDPARTWLNDQDVLTSPHIVAIAKIENSAATPDAMQKFHVPFEFKRQISKAEAESFQYSLAIVLSSSKYGAIFQGAVG
ncbi:PCMD domain-containing protein, partial [Streptococcus pyogenes]